MTGRYLSVPVRRACAAGAAVLLTGAGVCGIAQSAPLARADTAPVAGTPATVSADALPTVQVNGVVWSMATVGNTVYATGRFSQTWPARTHKTTKVITARANLLAFDITTGKLITKFNHKLNGQGLVVRASPDGTRVYVGGQFTSVDGHARSRIAAFDTATGALTGFRPNVAGTVEAITATNRTVFIGGTFTSVGGHSRVRLAALRAKGVGALTKWAPQADGTVQTMVLTPDHSRVVVGGRFSALNGVTAYGLGALGANLGGTVPYAANEKIHDYGAHSAIESLSADASSVYVSGYAFGSGNFEGTARLEPNTGQIIWLDDCHGDTYGTFPTRHVLYSVSHAHDCSAIGSFPNANPEVAHRALAEALAPTGVIRSVDSYGWDYIGTPASAVLPWFPTLSSGAYTGQNQAAWAVTGNSRYVAMGGEFPRVDGVFQHGLVRFAISSRAPNKSGPVADTTALTPQAAPWLLGGARLTWHTTWDHDNQRLTYKVYRDGHALPAYTTTAPSSFWQSATLTFTDTGLASGSTHTYVVRAYDPFGNRASGRAVSVTVN
jgi:hypothetical protein